MSSKRDLRQGIKSIMFNGEELYSIQGIVRSVDEDNLTCDVEPIEEAADLLDIKLMNVDENGNPVSGNVVIPAIDSVVTVTMLSPDSGYLAMFSKVDKVLWNGDNYGGLPIIGELVKKVNNLEKAYNDLASKYNAHTHTVSVVTSCPAGAGSGTGSAVATSTPETTVLQLTQVNDIENKTVLHGNGS